MRFTSEDAAVLCPLNLVELQGLGLQALREVEFAAVEALAEGLLQVAVVLDWLVKVWYRALEYVFDDALDEKVLLARELGVVKVAHCLQNDILF